MAKLQITNDNTGQLTGSVGALDLSKTSGSDTGVVLASTTQNVILEPGAGGKVLAFREFQASNASNHYKIGWGSGTGFDPSGVDTIDVESQNALVLKIDGGTSAVNYAHLTGGTTGLDVTLAAGGETDVGIDISPKGTGDVTIGTLVFDGDQTVGAGQDNYVLTYDDTSGTVRLEVATGGMNDLVDDTTPTLGGNLELSGLMFEDGGYVVLDAHNSSIGTPGQENYVNIANGNTGQNPAINAVGFDTNIGFRISPKGTGDVTISSGDLIMTEAGALVDGRDLTADGTKLDAIEAAADVTDATNVDAAGAVMESDNTTASMSFVIDEDNFASDLDTKVPTQQSVKAYVASVVASNMTYQGGYNASTNTPDLDTSPSGISIGDMYTCTAVGAFFATTIEIGDVLIAEQDNPTLEAHWTVVNKDLDAAGIKTSYESNADTNAYTDSEQTIVGNTSGTNTGDQIASGVTSTPAGDLVATDVQAALNELDTEKLALAGGTMSGAIAMGTSKITGLGDPTAAQDAVTKNYTDLFTPMLDGMVNTSVVFTVTESVGTVYANVTGAATSDFTVLLDNTQFTFDGTPAAQIALTAGSDASPTMNYIWIYDNGGTATLNTGTAGWPATMHAPVATVFCQSAATVATDGPMKVHVWTDHVQSSTHGHIGDINFWIRQQPATWESGSAVTPTAGAAQLDVALSAGVVLQLHEHVYPAFNTATGSEIHVINDPDVAYTKVANLTQAAGVDKDINGTALGSASTDFYNLVLWGVVSEVEADCKLMLNLPDGAYGNNNASAASNDTDNTAIYTIPSDYTGTGFLIARLTIQENAGTYTVIQNQDLRGLTPGTAAGGSGGTGGVVFADNVFRVQDEGDTTKEIAFQASGITTGTTRTLTVQDADGTLEYTSHNHSGTYEPADAALTSMAGLTYAQGDLLYATAADTITNLAKGTASQVLTMNVGATAPEWAASAGGTVSDLIDTTTILNGVAVGSAVNNFKLTNSITGNSLLLESEGTDTDIDITITPKGAGDVIIDGRTVSTDGAKLDAIEASADVTDSTNVDAAGAVMNSDSTVAGMSFVLDEDTMSSNLDTHVPTQQSVKAYADTMLPLAGGALTGAVTTTSTFDGRNVATDGTKLDAIEASATADQSDAEIQTAYENQTGVLMTTATVQTTNATQTDLHTIAVATDTEHVMEFMVRAIESTTGDAIWRHMKLGAKNDAGTVTIIGGVNSASGNDAGAATWNITAEVSTTNIVVKVTGEAAHTIDWDSSAQVF